MSDETCGVIGAVAMLSLLFVVNGCEAEPQVCSHWTIIDEHRVNAGTNTTNLVNRGVCSLKAERISMRLYGYCPISCSSDPYLIQATQEIAAEEKGL